ncbi:hypothetical protein [Streptomyces sp. NPDC059072]
MRPAPRRNRHVRLPTPSIDGLSARVMGEMLRLEYTRNHLNTADVALALDRWKKFVRRPESADWDLCTWGSVHWHCCGNPLEGRRLLDAVMRALSRRSARELRALIAESDSLAAHPALALMDRG